MNSVSDLYSNKEKVVGKTGTARFVNLCNFNALFT